MIRYGLERGTYLASVEATGGHRIPADVRHLGSVLRLAMNVSMVLMVFLHSLQE